MRPVVIVFYFLKKGGDIMDLSRFTDEQKAKIKACKTPEELMALADAEDFELSPDELEAVSGGDGSWDEDPSTDKTH